VSRDAVAVERNAGFAVKHFQGARSSSIHGGVHAIQPFLKERDLGIAILHGDGVVLKQLVDLHQRRSRDDLNAGVPQRVGDHAEAGVLRQAHEGSGREQHFGAALIGGQHRAVLHLGKLGNLGVEGFVVQSDGAFDVIDHPGMSGNGTLPPGAHRSR